jgi:pilus assembly protein FimV
MAQSMPYRLGSMALLVTALWMPRAEALGLGEARVTSGLNAPLIAEIEVLDATPAELQALRAEIPAREVFTRYGLDWPGFLSTASVTLRAGAGAAPVLVLRSEQPVSEPFITVLIAANWGRGRVLREYNLVVDRPDETVPGLAPVEVRGPTVDAGRDGAIEREEPVTIADPPPQPMRPASPEPTRSASAAAGSIEVRRGDTLSRIAEGVAQRSGVTRAQALVGLYQANPEAFGASMNDLRAGAVLRIPDAAELEALPPMLVAREVDRAIKDWRQRSGLPTRVADPGGRLRLVAPSEVTVGTGGGAIVPTGSGAGSAAAGRGEETVEQRLARIEAELIEKQRLLEVTSSQLAELQARAAEAPLAADAGALGALRGLLGKAWWLWFLAAAAAAVAASLFVGARRRAAAAESELDAYMRVRVAPTPAPAVEVAAWSTSAPAPAATPSSTSVGETTDLLEDPEGDPPMPDESGNKLDLARAFIEMGDVAAARMELEQVLARGDETQREDARRLLDVLH